MWARPSDPLSPHLQYRDYKYMPLSLAFYMGPGLETRVLVSFPTGLQRSHLI